MSNRVGAMIHSLRIKNFKCFEDQNFELGCLTLLSGLNGTGKSTVLQALILLRQSYQQGLLTAESSAQTPHAIMAESGLALNGDLIQLGTGRDVFYEGATSDEFGFTIKFGNQMTGSWLFTYDRVADVVKFSPASGQRPGEEEDPVYAASFFGDNFQYLSAERIGPRNSYPTSDFLVREHRQLGGRGKYTAHFLDLFRGQKIADAALAHPKVESRTLKAQVEAWMGEISPGVRIDLTPYSEIDQVVLQYSFAISGEVSNRYRPTNTGFGITYTLPVVVALLAASPGDLVLLENPEAHLHPQGQERIGELMTRAARCGIQVLAETHSDHVLNGVRIAVRQGLLAPEQLRIHFLEREEFSTRVISPRVDQNGRIDRWPDGFFDEWDKSLEKLL